MKKTLAIHPLDMAEYTQELVQAKPATYPYYTFAYLMEGEIVAEVDGKTILVSAGQLLLVPEGHLIHVRHYHQCQGFDGCFCLENLKDASYPVLRTAGPLLQSFWFDDAVFLGALMKRMVTAYADKDWAFLQSALDLILGQLRPGGRVAQVPEKFLQMVFERGAVPATVSAYAARLEVSPNYLNKTVKSHTHRTAIDWIEIARLNLAQQLLKNPEIPISEIAERTGLDDQSYFSRFFKRKTGLTPSQFRSKGERS